MLSPVDDVMSANRKALRSGVEPLCLSYWGAANEPPSCQPGEASEPWLYMLVGVGVGESSGEKLEAIEGHSLELPKEGQSISTVRRSDKLPWGLISSFSSGPKSFRESGSTFPPVQRTV